VIDMSEDKPNGADTSSYDLERRLNLLTRSLGDAHAQLERVSGDVNSIMPDPQAQSPGRKVKGWMIQNLTWILGALAAGSYMYIEWRDTKVEERIMDVQFEKRVDEKFEDVGRKFNAIEHAQKETEKDIEEIKAFQVLQHEDQRKLLLENLPRSKRNEFEKEPPELKEAKKALLAP